MSIYLCVCENCKKDVQSEEYLRLVSRKEFGKTNNGITIQKFICEECIDKFSKKDTISDD